MSESKSKEDINHRIKEWLLSEGYPLEFETASKFRKAGFSVSSGEYTREDKKGTPREIDVLASVRSSQDEIICDVSYIIECKYTVDKPWIFFTSDQNFSESACIAQTIGSDLGEAALWCLVGDSDLHKLSLFSAPFKPAFNAVEAFKKNNDRVYSALQSVISLSHSISLHDNVYRTKDSNMQRYCRVCIPVIVIKGRIFEASYVSSSNDIIIHEVEKTRIHWKGAEKRIFHATVDVVNINHIDEYAETAYRDSMILLNKLKDQCANIYKCFYDRSFKDLNVVPAGRGIIGTPKLLSSSIPCHALLKRNLRLSKYYGIVPL